MLEEFERDFAAYGTTEHWVPAGYGAEWFPAKKWRSSIDTIPDRTRVRPRPWPAGSISRAISVGFRDPLFGLDAVRQWARRPVAERPGDARARPYQPTASIA